MGLFSKLRRRIKKTISRVRTTVSTVKRKLRKVKARVTKAPQRIARTARGATRKLRRTAGSVYERADVAASGYLPGHITPTQAKTRRLRKRAGEITQLSTTEADYTAAVNLRKLRQKQEKETLQTEQARIDAIAAEERQQYTIREDLATRGFLEIRSPVEKALAEQQELLYGTEALEALEGGAISPLLEQAAAGPSGFGEDVKKVGIGIGAVILGLAALIGLSKMPNLSKSRRR